MPVPSLPAGAAKYRQHADLTDRMHEHYTTAQADEHHDGIERVIDVFAHHVTDTWLVSPVP